MNQKTTHLSSRLESSVCALAKNNHQVKMLVYTGYPFFFFFLSQTQLYLLVKQPFGRIS